MKKNKGFTMVELIIVIAIIAVLAAVLAPQYFKYVEESRKATDLQIATGYIEAATIAVTMLELNSKFDDSNPDAIASDEWYYFKWGYETGYGTDMNMHMGTATVTAEGVPNGYVRSGRNATLQNTVGSLMGWVDEKGNLSLDLIQRPQSSSVQRTSFDGNSFVFYLNIRTGEVLIDRTLSSNWVTEIGVDYPLSA